MHIRSQSIVAGAFAVTVAAIAAPAQQAATPPEQERWSWMVAPSVISPSTSRSVQGVSNGFADKGEARGGAGLTLQASKGVWSFVVDGLYYGANSAIFPGGFPNGAEIDSGSQFASRVIVEGFAFRRIVPSLELALGVVGNSVHTTATTYGLSGSPGPAAPFTASAQRTKNWATPAFAARWRPIDAARWTATLAADFGYWSLQNKTWQIAPSVGYRASHRVTVLAMYRWMSTLYSIKPGFTTEEFTIDSYLHGPVLGVGLNF